MKMLKAVLDPRSFQLLGFVASGKKSEFMEMKPHTKGSGEQVERMLSLRQLVDLRVDNHQINAKNGSISFKNGFKPNYLEAVDSNGNSINNEIHLTHRVVDDKGKLLGYVAVVGGNQKLTLRYEDVVRIARLLRPVNFFIKRRVLNDGGYTDVITGHPGNPLTDLPSHLMKSSVNKDKKEADGKQEQLKEKQEQLKEKQEKQEVPKVGLVDFFEWLSSTYNSLGLEKKTGVYVIKFPEDEYKASPSNTKTAGDDLIRLGLPEIGEVKLDFGAKKLNANVLFKKVGVVMVNAMPVYTFTYSNKSVFKAAKMHMGRFGIALSEEGIARLEQTFGRSYFLERVTDDKIIKAVHAVTGNNNLAVIEVNTKNMVIMKHIEPMSEQQLISATSALVCLSRAKKEVDAALKDINKIMEENLGAEKAAQMKGLPSNLQMFAGNDEMLRAISLAGIDLRTGAYTVTKDIDSSSKEDSEHDQKEVAGEVIVEYVSLVGGKEFKLNGLEELCSPENRDKMEHLISKQMDYGREALGVVNNAYGILENCKVAFESKDAAELITGKDSDLSVLKSLQVASIVIYNHIIKIKKMLWLNKASLYNEGGVNAITKGFTMTKSLKAADVYDLPDREGYSVRIKARG